MGSVFTVEAADATAVVAVGTAAAVAGIVGFAIIGGGENAATG